MNLNHQILIFAVMITVSFIVSAEKVYESVDEEGVIEFSDKPSSDAQVIDVEKPNVADTVPTEQVKPSSSASKTSTNEKPASSEQPEIIHVGGDSYIDDDEKRRKMHREKKERMEDRKEVVRQPVRKGVHRK